ncbi:uncharacterized protein [Macrobrachium rosenbergii]|uniref:uncharacterized protein n=1 Tax=Macrobrachium rosenbergii TaxID=79674 RepID=UPI0034D7A48B
MKLILVTLALCCLLLGWTTAFPEPNPAALASPLPEPAPVPDPQRRRGGRRRGLLGRLFRFGRGRGRRRFGRGGFRPFRGIGGFGGGHHFDDYHFDDFDDHHFDDHGHF